MAEEGEDSCPKYLPEGFQILVKLAGKKDHFGDLEFSERKDPRLQAEKAYKPEEGNDGQLKSSSVLTDPKDYENLYYVTIPFSFIKKMEFD